MKVNSLTDAEAQYISIVNKPANRAPFKMLKNAEGKADMKTKAIDLMQVAGMIRKSEPKKQASIVGIVINKSANVEEITKSLKEAGFNTDNIHTEDESEVLILKQDESDIQKDDTFVKLNEDVAVQVRNFKYIETDWSSESFADLFTTRNVIPSFYTMASVLGDVLCNIVYNSKDPLEISSKLQIAIDEFQKVALNIVNQVPITAFKMEDVLNKALESTTQTNETKEPDTVQKDEAEMKLTKAEEELILAKREEEKKAAAKKAAEKKKPPVAGEPDGDEAAMAKKKAKKAKAKKEEAAEEEVEDQEDDADEAEDEVEDDATDEEAEDETEDDADDESDDEEEETVQKSDDAPVLALLQKMSKKLDSLTKSQSKLAEDVESVKKEASEAKTSAKKAEKAAAQVTGISQNGDKTKSSKSEEVSSDNDGLFDTGYARLS